MSARGGKRTGAGRKAKADADKLVQIVVKVHPVVAARWKALGSTPGERADLQRAVVEAGMRVLKVWPGVPHE